VDYVLEGSVRREVDRVLVTVQLIRASDQIHLWTENFDRPLQSILDIHSEVGVVRSCWNKWDGLRSNLGRLSPD